MCATKSVGFPFQVMAHHRFLQFQPLVGRPARQDLQPEVAHFVGGLVSPSHRRRGRLGLSGLAAELS